MAEPGTTAEVAPDDKLAKLYAAKQKAMALGRDDFIDVLDKAIHAETRKMRTADTAAAGEEEVLPSVRRSFVAGAGRGLENAALNVADVAGRIPGLEGLRPSPEKFAELKETDPALLASAPGIAGNILGETAATAPVGLARLPAAAKGAPLLLRALTSPVAQATAQGAAQGALLAGPDNRAAGALVGGGTGGLLTGALGLVAGPFRGALTKAGQWALEKGREAGIVPTMQQLAPGSLPAVIESVGEHMPGLRKAVESRAQATADLWRNEVAKAALPPGAPILRGGNPENRIGELQDLFESAYGKVPSRPLELGAPLGDVAEIPGRPLTTAEIQALPQAEKAAVVKQMLNTGKPPTTAATPAQQGLFSGAVEDPNVLTTDADRAAVRRYLDNQLTLLKPNETGQIDSADLLKMRSNIRRAIREGSKVESKADQVKLLQNAETAINESLAKADPELTAQLQELDKAYRQFKPVEKAQAKSRSLEGFTPADLTREVNAVTPDAVLARGGGGPMADLAETGRELLTQRTPLTGVRMLPHAAAAGAGAILGHATGIPGLGELGGSALGPYALSAPLLSGTVRRGLVGDLTLQKAIQEELANPTLKTLLPRTLGIAVTTPEGQ